MDLNDLLVFVKVAQIGSFSRAAPLLKMPLSTVSRRVAKLEDELGLTLLVRTTRSLRLTDAGRAYLKHGTVIGAELERLEGVSSQHQGAPQGSLKITATTDFGNQFLGRIVSDFLQAHPRVDLDVVLTERVVDLIEEGFDLAIRIGELEDSSQAARRIGSLDMQLFASPAFIKAHGEPSSCADLARFDCILFSGEEEPTRWHLDGPRSRQTVKVRGRVVSNNMALIRDLAISGEGIALMPFFLCADEVKAGRLKLLLKDWAHAAGPLHVLYPEQRYVLPKVRAFVDHLARACAGVQWKGRR